MTVLWSSKRSAFFLVILTAFLVVLGMWTYVRRLDLSDISLINDPQTPASSPPTSQNYCDCPQKCVSWVGANSCLAPSNKPCGCDTCDCTAGWLCVKDNCPCEDCGCKGKRICRDGTKGRDCTCVGRDGGNLCTKCDFNDCDQNECECVLLDWIGQPLHDQTCPKVEGTTLVGKCRVKRFSGKCFNHNNRRRIN